jgi:acetolactate synthase regulatory subunit
MLLLPPGVAPRSVSTLSVDVLDAPGALLRVLTICQRRGAKVVALTYHGSRIELALDAELRVVDLICAKLEATIDVRAVSYAGSKRTSPPSNTARTAEPTVTDSGSQLTRFDSTRGPSSSSTYAST